MIRMLVIGIRGEMAHDLKERYKGVIKFTFLTDSVKVGKTAKGTYDYVYAFWKFTNHSVERNYGSHVGYVRVRSNTQLEQHLLLLTQGGQS